MWGVDRLVPVDLKHVSKVYLPLAESKRGRWAGARSKCVVQGWRQDHAVFPFSCRLRRSLGPDDRSRTSPRSWWRACDLASASSLPAVVRAATTIRAWARRAVHRLASEVRTC